MQVLNINKVHEVESYPYGRLRTKAFFSIEFVPGKGFRSVFQTINPKNGRVNAPKKSTYCAFMCNYIEAESGHIKNYGLNINSFEGVNKLVKVVAEYKDALQLTDEMKRDVYRNALVCLRMNAKFTSADPEQLIATIKPATEALVALIKDPNCGRESEVVVDANRIEELEKEFIEAKK